MTRALSSWSGLFAAVLMLAAAPAGAADRAPGWIPFIDFSVDLHKDDVRSEANPVPGPLFLQPYAKRKNYRNTPLGFIGRLGVLTPELASNLGRPRMFLNAGVYATPETNEEILETGKLDLKPAPFTQNGQGSRITRRFQNPAGVVGLGAKFTLPWVDERFRLSPSVEYQVEKLEIEGEYIATAPNGTTFDLGADAEEVYHSVGLGLEGEFVVTGGLSLYLNTRLLWLITDEKLEFNDSPFAGFVYERQDSPAFSGAFGFRYSFLGF